MPGTSGLSTARRADVTITAALDERPHRAPDYAAESHAMHRLAQTFTASDGAVLQTLAEIALSLCGAGSAGISLFEPTVDRKSTLRWVATSGFCGALTDTVVPTEDSPSGITLETGAAQLFAFPQRHFACVAHIHPEVIEELVVPIPGQPEPWGALWVMSHEQHHLFDAEDRRILTSLANFTCAALNLTRARDDAEARAAEAEAARNALALAEARKDDFIATLSHELRNPIAPIDNALTAARRLLAGNPSAVSVLDVANRQMRLLKRLVSDLLDASRIRHGKLSVRFTHGLLQDIVADAVTTVETDIASRRHRLHTTMPPYPVNVLADPVRLTQVVSNLLSNAVKYTPPGGDITLHVEAPELGAEPPPDASACDAVITVKDSGVGISPVLLPHVFDMFVQSALARKRAEGGLGIGLAVVKYLVAAHNGTVSLASAGEGHGAEVTVRLPIVRELPDDAASTPAQRTATSVRILLVDDNADAIEALGTLLELDGHEVKRAQNGPDALSIVESFTPDVALVDITMPGMDGIELAQLLRLRAQCALTKLVAVTGYTDADSRFRDDEQVFDCYLTKPVSLNDLTDVLRGS